MSVIAVGLNYQVADVSVIERLSFAHEEIPKALGGLLQCDHITEAVILSTCNRVELYAKANRFHPAAAEAREFLSEFHHTEPSLFADRLYTYFDEAAIAHLFAVTSGLDSMVLGESEITGQVRGAFAVAQVEASAGRTLSALFRRALEVGKRIRTETGISKNAASVSSAAVSLAAHELEGIEGKTVVVLGAGEAGLAAARALLSAGAAGLVVANRSIDKAEEVASRVGGCAVALGDLDVAIDDADILVTSTRSPEIVIDASTVSAMAARRQNRPLLIVDIAVPRDVDPEAASIDGVTLLDMDDLKASALEGRRMRAAEATRGREIIATEVERFLDDEMAARYGSLVAELRSAAESIRSDEVDRYSQQFADLTDEQRDAVDALTRSLLNKFLHTPTVRMRELATTSEGEALADALAKLFELTDPIQSGSDDR